jgi:hypothetical protein
MQQHDEDVWAMVVEVGCGGGVAGRGRLGSGGTWVSRRAGNGGGVEGERRRAGGDGGQGVQAGVESRRARGGKKNPARSGMGKCKIRIIYASLNAPIVDKT